MKKILCAIALICGIVVPSEPVQAYVGEVYNIQLGASIAYEGGAAYNPSATDYFWAQGASAEQDPHTFRNANNENNGVKYSYWVGGTEGQHSASTSIGAPDTKLFTGYLLTDAVAPAWFLFSGLDYGEYDIYVYSQKESGHSGSLSITANGGSTSLSNDGSLNILKEGVNGNYRIINNVIVGGSGNLNFAMGTSSVINGIQLVHKSPNPEPASMLLLGVGGALAAAKLRRKRGGEASSAVVS
ncbi:MAG: PEP-CTERM sorting domain-containing protein [Pelodictyon phaeoclathratiforme]